MAGQRTLQYQFSWKLAGTLLSVGFFCLAMWLLHRAVRQYQFADIVERLREIPTVAVAAAVVLSLLSYLALGGFDWLAVRFIGRGVPARRTFLASFVSHAVSHSAGFAALTGGAVRYRFYAASGMTALEVGAVQIFCGWTFVVGASSLAGLALLIEPGRFAALSGIPVGGLRLAGAGVLALVAVYAVLGWALRRPLRIGDRAFTLPGPRVVLAQLVFAVADLGFAAAALWVLLPEGAPSLPALLGIYVLANLAGLMAHVPGGLGVFETAVVLMLPDLRADAVLGSLVLWRAAYNLVPLVLAGLLMMAYELLTRRRALERAAREARLWLRQAEPPVAALLVFLAGATLVLSGAAPEDPQRLARLGAVLPAGVVQGAHVVASGVGMGLMLCARGLLRRLDDAYAAARLLLVLGASAAVLRGVDVEEAAALALLVLLLTATQAAFYRHGGAAVPGLSPAWAGAAAVVLIAAGWLTLLAFRRAADPDLELLADFSLAEGAARALRGEVAAVAVFIGGLVVIARRGGDGAAPEPSAADLARAAELIRAGQRAAAHRALNGELRLMFDATRRAVLAYRVIGRHWIAVGDPVGPEDAWLDLVWRFRESAEAAGAAAGFLEVPNRPLYLDLGLAFTPFGEAVAVELRGLAGRRGDNRFTVSPPDLGAHPLAVLSEGGRRLAQAPLWQADGGGELALGPIEAETPKDAERLVAEAMLWGARHGWRSFDLGIVPSPELPPGLPLRLAPPAVHGPVMRRPVFAALPEGVSLAALAGLSGSPGG